MGTDGAYLAGLKMLARRELSEAQVRQRLERRQFEHEDIDDAVGRLKREKALDDRRTARACARTEAGLRHHGRLRAMRTIEAMGIARSVARDAVAEVFADLDENTLIEQALDRRLRRSLSLQDAASVRRIHRYLLAQGFDPARVLAVLRKRGAELWE